MNWSEIPAAAPVAMTGLLAFMERWKPGSTEDFQAASADQIRRLAERHGGPESLPPVYHEFLATMGEAMGPWRLTRGTTSISSLLEDAQETGRERADPSRYLKFAIGEDDYNGRQPDDFFDLARPTQDGTDAFVFRLQEERLIRGAPGAEYPFPTFSDLLRAVLVSKVALDLERGSPPFFSLGRHPDVVARAFRLLANLGFATTELAASLNTIPLEARGRGAVALLRRPSDRDVSLRVRARDDAEERRLVEIIADHRAELMQV
jgi:hypothetical protein